MRVSAEKVKPVGLENNKSFSVLVLAETCAQSFKKLTASFFLHKLQ